MKKKCEKNRWHIAAIKSQNNLQGVPTQTVILHFALAGKNMQGSFGLKVVWES